MRGKRPSQEQHKNNRDQAPRPFVSFLRIKDKSKYRESETDNTEQQLAARYYKWEKRSVIASGAATVVIALFTLASVVVAALQWGAIKRADDTTRESFVAVQRPFITVPELKIEQVGDIWWVGPVVENSGGTPSKDMQIKMLVGEEHYPTDPRRFLIMPSDPTENYPGRPIREIIGPKSRRTYKGGGLTNIIQEMQLTRIAYYARGAITYSSHFTHPENYITKYCFQLGLRLLKNENPVIEYNPCHHWNCADDECKRDKEEYDAEVREIEAKPR